MQLSFGLAAAADIEELAALYDALIDHLVCGENFPGWRKGVYPTRADAERGLAENALYVARHNGRLAGTIILSHRPEPAYQEGVWKTDADYRDIFVIYTFAVHPAFLKAGVGKAMLEFSERLAKERGMKAIRLDVYENNTPAIRLYEKCGYHYAGTVDLGLSEYGLEWFRLYEKLL